MVVLAKAPAAAPAVKLTKTVWYVLAIIYEHFLKVFMQDDNDLRYPYR